MKNGNKILIYRITIFTLIIASILLSVEIYTLNTKINDLHANYTIVSDDCKKFYNDVAAERSAYSSLVETAALLHIAERVYGILPNTGELKEGPSSTYLLPGGSYNYEYTRGWKYFLSDCRVLFIAGKDEILDTPDDIAVRLDADIVIDELNIIDTEFPSIEAVFRKRVLDAK